MTIQILVEKYSLLLGHLSEAVTQRESAITKFKEIGWSPRTLDALRNVNGTIEYAITQLDTDNKECKQLLTNGWFSKGEVLEALKNDDSKEGTLLREYEEIFSKAIQDINPHIERIAALLSKQSAAKSGVAASKIEDQLSEEITRLTQVVQEQYCEKFTALTKHEEPSFEDTQNIATEQPSLQVLVMLVAVFRIYLQSISHEEQRMRPEDEHTTGPLFLPFGIDWSFVRDHDKIIRQETKTLSPEQARLFTYTLGRAHTRFTLESKKEDEAEYRTILESEEKVALYIRALAAYYRQNNTTEPDYSLINYNALKFGNKIGWQVVYTITLNSNDRATFVWETIIYLNRVIRNPKTALEAAEIVCKLYEKYSPEECFEIRQGYLLQELLLEINNMNDLKRAISIYPQLRRYCAPEYDRRLSSWLYKRYKDSFRGWRSLKQLLAVAEDVLALLGCSEYTWKLLEDNRLYQLRKERKFARLQFNKTGSTLIPLGGSLTGFMIRIIPKTSYEAWKKAFELGIPTEEIVKDGRGEYRVREHDNESVAVITKYCGELFVTYCIAHMNEQEQLTKQRDNIIEQLEINKIKHGHPHDGNFTVDTSSGKPIVRIIDFDQAVS